MKKHFFLLTLLSLTGCMSDSSEHWQAQDNAIDVIETPQGLAAVPPTCRRFDDLGGLTRMENDPLPQLGCATAGNLAAQIVNPADLVRGELYPDTTAHSDGTVGAAAIQRYHEGKVYAPTLTPAVTEGSSQ